jgi:hypothetical protein
VFCSETWAHFPNGKRKELQPKSKKCVFVGYSKYIKGYRLLQPKSIEIIIRRYFKFDEGLLVFNPNSTFVPFLTCDPYSTSVPSSLLEVYVSDPILVSFFQNMSMMMKIHLHLLTFL